MNAIKTVFDGNCCTFYRLLGIEKRFLGEKWVLY
jgi:hypothetical protein